MRREAYYFLMLPILVLLVAGCASAPRFTFSGVNLDPRIKSFSVENFANEAMDGPPNLGILFSEEMREYFQRNTPLDQVTGAGDLQFFGQVTRYDVRPMAAGAGEFQTAELQRLTIGVSVDFVNLFDEDKSFENSSFSFFADFDASQNLADVEDGLIEEIFDQIIFDIFNRTAADW